MKRPGPVQGQGPKRPARQPVRLVLFACPNNGQDVNCPGCRQSRSYLGPVSDAPLIVSHRREELAPETAHPRCQTCNVALVAVTA